MNWKTNNFPDDKPIIVTVEYNGKRFVEMGSFIGGTYVGDNDDYLVSGIKNSRKVIAWDYLPKPYRR